MAPLFIHMQTGRASDVRRENQSDHQATDHMADAKARLGFVETPRFLVDQMLDMVKVEVDASDRAAPLAVLDCGAGAGAIGGRLLERCPGAPVRVDFVEVNPALVDVLQKRSEGERSANRARVFACDFLSMPAAPEYDYVIANPPYNAGGAIKTPTNTTLRKSDDGRAVWRAFVEKAVRSLKPGGEAVLLVPSAWMRGRCETHALLTRECVPLRVRCMNNTETNRAFGMQAQTPTCIVHVRRRREGEQSAQHVELYDPGDQEEGGGEWVRFPLFSPSPSPPRSAPLPTSHARILAKLKAYVDAPHVRSLRGKVRKTTLPTQANPVLREKEKEQHGSTSYANVRTCVLVAPSPSHVHKGMGRGMRRRKRPALVYEQTAAPTKHARPGLPKLVLAHKMYGLPFLDASGDVGVTNADSYVVLPDDDEKKDKDVNEKENEKEKDAMVAELLATQRLLCGPLALLVFESVRYRMRFLEREAFDFLPDVRSLLSEAEGAAAEGAAGRDLEARAMERAGLDAADVRRVRRFGEALRFEVDPRKMLVQT